MRNAVKRQSVCRSLESVVRSLGPPRIASTRTPPLKEKRLRRVVPEIGRVLGHVFRCTDVSHSVVVSVSRARGAARGRSQAHASASKQSNAEVGSDAAGESASMGIWRWSVLVRSSNYSGTPRMYEIPRQKYKSGRAVLSPASESLPSFGLKCLDFPPFPLRFLPPPPRSPSCCCPLASNPTIAGGGDGQKISPTACGM